jgi:hypothetical protein
MQQDNRLEYLYSLSLLAWLEYPRGASGISSTQG